MSASLSRKRAHTAAALASAGEVSVKRAAAFESFGDYMAVKEHKLREQQRKDAQAATGCQNLDSGPMRGVCIWVDGRTDPPREVLRTLITRAGGRFETYLHRDLVTHVVATHFAKGRAKELRRAAQKLGGGAGRALNVVSPAWVVDSVRAGRPLPEWKYSVDDVSRDAQQTTLPAQTLRSIDAQVRCETNVASNVSAATTQKQQRETTVDPSGALKADEVPSSPLNTRLDQVAYPVNHEESFPHLGELALPETTMRGLRSSRETPNFVREFFAQSRLHLIGSFRETYEGILRKLQRDLHSIVADAPRTLPHSSCFVLHVDMDAFFVSVSLAKYPHLRGKPVAVCHSGSGEHSRAEISSASYEARARGVRANMFFGEALRRCPDLVMIPYDFAAYKEACERLYRILFTEADVVEGVSIDEAYLLLQHCENVTQAEAMAARIRQRIVTEIEGCTASIGIGRNKLFARLATKHGKEKLGQGSQFVLVDRAHPLGFGTPMGADLRSFLDELPVRFVSGVGWSTEERLRAAVEAVAPESLQAQQPLKVGTVRAHLTLSMFEKSLGAVNGNRIYRLLHGEDPRPVQPMGPRKSVSAQIGWGVRFLATEEDKVRKFMTDLALVVAERLREARIARCSVVTVTALRRQTGAGMPYKPLGHGLCDEFSATSPVEWYVCAGDPCLQSKVDADFADIVWNLYQGLQIAPDALRGAGVHARKLVEVPAHSGIVQPACASGKDGPLSNVPQQLSLPAAWRSRSSTNAADMSCADAAEKQQPPPPPPPPPPRTIPLAMPAAVTPRDRKRTLASLPSNAVSMRSTRRTPASSGAFHIADAASADKAGNSKEGQKLFKQAHGGEWNEATGIRNTRPPTPPDVDQEVWHALPIEVTRQVWKENLAQEQLRRWKLHRSRHANGVLDPTVPMFQPSLPLFSEIRSRQVALNGAVLYARDLQSFWRTTKPVRTAERPSGKTYGFEDRLRGRVPTVAAAAAASVATATEPMLSLAQWSSLLHAYLQKLSSQRAYGSDLGSSWHQFHVKVLAFVEEVAYSRRWAFLCAFLELLRGKLSTFSRDIRPNAALLVKTYEKCVELVQIAWMKHQSDRIVPGASTRPPLAIQSLTSKSEAHDAWKFLLLNTQIPE